MIESQNLTVYPLTIERWEDFMSLFGPRGACAGCWCMYWKLKRKDFELLKGDGTRQLMRGLVERGAIPGLLAYDKGKVVGWCAIARREDYVTLERSRVLKRVDEQPVWSIVCFYVKADGRKKGITTGLIKAAIDYICQQGGKIVEGYPIQPKKDQIPAVFAYTGFYSTFINCGFVEAARNSATRPIMRYTIR
jgi:GNAT superfamily N-acetyltransferase